MNDEGNKDADIILNGSAPRWMIEAAQNVLRSSRAMSDLMPSMLLPRLKITSLW